MSTCATEFSLPVSGACGTDADWQTGATACRLRIKNYNELLYANCPAFDNCGGGPCNPWNATLPNWDGVNKMYYYVVALGVLAIHGKMFFEAYCQWDGAKWNLTIIGTQGGLASTIWKSTTGGSGLGNPVGVYSFNNGCDPNPATIELESYI